MTWILALVAALVAVALLPPLRRIVLTGPIFAIYKRMLPAMSQTEREALEAGTVWWEGELFSGKPDWNTLHAYPQPS
jgi:acyl-CoA dehydrogenase